MANGETIRRQGCKYFALIIRMIVAVITTCWGTSCYHGQTSLPKRFWSLALLMVAEAPSMAKAKNLDKNDVIG